MQKRVLAAAGCSSVGLVVAVVACGRGDAASPSSLPATCPTATDSASPSGDAPSSGRGAEYVVADPPRSAGTSLVTLGKDETGVVVEGLRIVAHGRGQRVAADVVDPPITAVHRAPEAAGGGFVFTSNKRVYHAREFDGPLRPLTVPAGAVSGVSFLGRTLVVHRSRGARAILDLPTGRPAAATPIDVADAETTTDGRIAALTAHGTAFAGEAGKLREVTRELGAAPARLALVGGDVFVVDQNNQALRVDPGGATQLLDAPPPPPKLELRPKDPRWRGTDTPLRTAIRNGIVVDEGTALVFDAGDVARVDLRTGALRSARPSKLPHDLPCEPVRTPDGTVVVCARAGVGALAAARADEEPEIEQRFVGAGGFVASDDGGLLFAGPCQPGRSGTFACVRQPRGQWREVELTAPPAPDAGGVIAVAPTKSHLGAEVVRWVPRADGTALAVVAKQGGKEVEIVDPVLRQRRSLSSDPAQRPAIDALVAALRRGDAGRVVSRSWTVTPQGVVRGWGDKGVIDILDDGLAVQSLAQFEMIGASGSYALARGKGGRAFQTIDRGATWIEVLAPPTGRPTGNFEVRACSAVGCDLGAFYRVGWRESAPSPIPEAKPPTPGLAAVDRAPELSCESAGDERFAKAPAGEEDEAEAYGLGAVRLPKVKDPDEAIRGAYGRAVSHPVHDGGGSGAEGDGAIRLLLGGFDLDDSGGAVVVKGPVKNPAEARFTASFVAPFDPAAGIRRPTFPASEIVARARALGASVHDAIPLPDDSIAAPITSADPALPDDLAVHGASGVVIVLRDGARVRFGTAQEMRLGGGAVTGPGEHALLFVDEEGRDHVRRFDGVSTSDLFEVPPPPSSSAYPENVDAVALGDKGALGVLRTPSGSAPPSELDPAFVIPRGGAPIVLAPWSTLATADTAACRADPSGWRATLATSGSWVRFAQKSLRASDSTTTLLRVRWSATRVCLEAIELRRSTYDVTRARGGARHALDPWLVARFGGPKPEAAFVAVDAGREWRQPVRCALASSP